MRGERLETKRKKVNSPPIACHTNSSVTLAGREGHVCIYTRCSLTPPPWNYFFNSVFQEN